MTLTQLAPPYPIFTDKNGDPLDAGYLYFGVANLNPETNPIQVYYDSAFTQPAAQPLRTSNGYVMRNGSPALIFSNSQFSVTVRDKNNALVIYSPVGYGFTPETTASRTDQMIYNEGSTGAVDRILTSRLQDYVSIKDFGATGSGDAVVDTAALIAAVGTGGRAVFFPNGLYIINFVNLPSNTMLFGEGAGSIIRTAQAVRCAIGCDSGDPNLFIENIAIKDLRLEGRVVADGFAEQRHISSWNGAKNLLIDNCQFIGFQGDGIYIGMGNVGGQVRHNVNVTIRNCFFDGVNKDNRQGVSVIDCDGLLIEGCYFTRTTRSNMPGAIDIEPNGDVRTVVRDIKITNNKFFDIGGNVACISVFLPNAENYITPYQGFLVEGNFIENASKGIIYYPVIAAGVTNSMHDQGVRIVNNITTNTGRSIEIYNAKGALVEGNQFIRGSATSLIGFTGSPAKSIDLTLRNNQFIQSGYSSGDGLTVFNVERLTLEGNLFKDCGNGSPGSGDAINFSVNSSSSYVRIVNNIITSPNGNTLVAIQKEATHTFAPETNEFRGNTITVGGNSFQAIDNDVAETSYSPIVTGSSTAGAGTYTIQYGRWRRRGKLIFFRLKLTVDAGHTGTGMIQVTLPTLAVTAASNEETTVAVSVSGVATTGGQIGLINPGVNVGGVGAIRLYHTTTGSLAQTIIPAGAFTITASGFYQER